MLDNGEDTDTSCVFAASFEADRSEDGRYRITAGNVNRGFVNYAEQELLGDTLYADTIID